MKRDKADGVVDLVSNNFINGPDCMIIYLSDLYACCLHHGFMPEAKLLSTVTPISKDPKVTGQTSNSYRGTALSAMYTKVFEYVILNMHSDSLILINLQFAYKAGTSTTQCIWAAREVISYYNNKGSDVYCCLLDCSKAFDQIKHDKLLQNLVAKNVPPVIIRETWLLKSHLNLLDKIHDNYMWHAVSDINENKQVLRGRPYGCTAILYKKSIA